jgi:polysaccharide pyruvyl transferase WcaK-like protein
MRIAVFGHVGQENLGDEAAFQAVLEAVKRHRPDAEILGISVDPADTRSRYGIAAYPIWREAVGAVSRPAEHGKAMSDVEGPPRSHTITVAGLKSFLRRMPVARHLAMHVMKLVKLVPAIAQEIIFLLKIRRLLRRVDLLAVAGSQHLNDYVLGPWNFPYTMWKWTMAAKSVGTKIAFVNVGAGPLRTDLGKWFIKQAVAWSDYQSYRDISSIRCLEQLGVPIRATAVPDLVFTLRLPARRLQQARLHRKKIVGINPIPFNSADYWVGASNEGYQRYVQVLASFAEWLLSRGLNIVFFPTQLTLDPRVIRDIRARLNDGAYQPGAVTEASIKSVEDLCAAIESMDFVVASRFHGLVFSMLLEKPVLGISYADKGRDLMASMGQSSYVLDIMALDLTAMQQRFQEMELRQDDIRSVLRERAVQHRHLAEAQLKELFALVG